MKRRPIAMPFYCFFWVRITQGFCDIVSGEVYYAVDFNGSYYAEGFIIEDLDARVAGSVIRFHRAALLVLEASPPAPLRGRGETRVRQEL